MVSGGNPAPGQHRAGLACEQGTARAQGFEKESEVTTYVYRCSTHGTQVLETPPSDVRCPICSEMMIYFGTSESVAARGKKARESLFGPDPIPAADPVALAEALAQDDHAHREMDDQQAAEDAAEWEAAGEAAWRAHEHEEEKREADREVYEQYLAGFPENDPRD